MAWKSVCISNCAENTQEPMLAFHFASCRLTAELITGQEIYFHSSGAPVITKVYYVTQFTERL